MVLGIRHSSAVVGSVRYFSLRDDAMISMRYAHNAAAGLGLVWNPGDSVEGFTNLGWTLLMIVPHVLRLPASFASLAVQVTNLALLLALVTLVFFSLRRTPMAPAAGLAAFLVAVNGPLLSFSIGGFETTLQALLVTAALLPLHPAVLQSGLGVRARRLAPILLGIAFVVRPDSIVLLVVVSLVVAAGSFWQNGRPGLDVGSLIPIGLAGGMVAAVLLWQRAYYGDWLPNTAALKASADARALATGFDYLRRFVVTDLQAGIVIPALAYLAAGLLGRSGRLAYVPSCLLIGAWIGYVVWVGGDVFPQSRFFIPIIPILAVYAASFVYEFLLRYLTFEWVAGPPVRAAVSLAAVTRSTVAGLAGVVLCTLAVLDAPYQVYAFAQSQRVDNASLITVARALNELGLAPETTIGVFWAGILPYFMPAARFHDMLGKSDAYIARTPAKWGPPGHMKWDYDYSFRQVKPDLIVTGTYDRATDEGMARLVERRAGFGFYYTLWLDPGFRELYLPNRIPIKADNPSALQQWVYRRAAAD
jgi:hypothetical protein